MSVITTCRSTILNYLSIYRYHITRSHPPPSPSPIPVKTTPPPLPVPTKHMSPDAQIYSQPLSPSTVLLLSSTALILLTKTALRIFSLAPSNFPHNFVPPYILCFLLFSLIPHTYIYMYHNQYQCNTISLPFFPLLHNLIFTSHIYISPIFYSISPTNSTKNKHTLSDNPLH